MERISRFELSQPSAQDTPQWAIWLSDDEPDRFGREAQPFGPLNISQARERGLNLKQVGDAINAELLATVERLTGEVLRKDAEIYELKKLIP